MMSYSTPDNRNLQTYLAKTTLCRADFFCEMRNGRKAEKTVPRKGILSSSSTTNMLRKLVQFVPEE